MRIVRPLAALAALLVANVAQPHDLWLEREEAGYTLFQGHQHSAHAGDDLVPYATGFVQAARCLQHDGSVGPVALADDAYPARFAAECAALLVEASSGAWSTTAQGTRNEAPGDRPGVLRSWESFEAVKRLDAWHEALRAPLGDALEIVLRHDPFVLGRRDKLRLHVTLRGQPQPGVIVAYAGEARGVTGADGQVNLRIRTTGLQFITASFREPAPAGTGGVADWVHGTALQFHLD